jgi:hypothetical protein
MSRIKVFKGSINQMEATINEWAETNAARILSTSMCYDEGAGLGSIFVIVLYDQRATAAAEDR